MEKLNVQKKLILIIACLILAVAVSGCGGIGSYVFTFGLKKSYVAGYSVEERPIKVSVLGHGKETTFFIATIHGNEWAGTPLAEKLEKHLIRNRKLLKGKKVLIIPVANPDGFAANIRHNSNGIDLNRNFEAENRENNSINGFTGLSEPESVTLHKIIEKYQPQKVVSIHQPLACIDYDGPAEELAMVMSKQCGLIVKKLGSRPGSLGSYVGVEKNTPIITMELYGTDHKLSPEKLWIN